MNLSCKVVEDLLPIYYDCVCSDESAALIESHIKECPNCSRTLIALQCEVEIPKLNVDDRKPLDSIEKKWKCNKRTYLLKGICITLAALALLFAVLTIVWYFVYAKYWFRLTDVMERTVNEDAYLTSSDYTLQNNGYQYDVCLPVVLSDSGFARVMAENGLVLFLYPEIGGSYSFWLYVTDNDKQSYSVYLKSDMSPDFENHPFPVRNEKEKQHISKMLVEQEKAITSMLAEIQELWGVELLEYAP